MTEAELVQNYASIRNRLYGSQLPVIPRRLVTPKQLPKPPPPPPVEVKRKRRHRDFLFVASREVMSKQMWRHAEATAVVEATAKRFGVEVEAITGAIRDKRTCAARFEACYKLYHGLGYSLAMVGKVMGGRGHASILHALKAHEKRISGRN